MQWSPLYLTAVFIVAAAVTCASCAPQGEATGQVESTEQAEPTDQVELVLVNRSNVAVAFLPGMVVGPCAEGRYTEAQIEAALDRFTPVSEDDSWVPPGAAPFQRGLAGHRMGEPQTLVISGSSDPVLIDGEVPPVALPACGGDPVGIN